MKWLKISALLVLTLAVMRAGSWAVAWALARFVVGKRRMIAIVANMAACTAFLLLLYFNLLPGEPIDLAAVCFGLSVFLIYTATDFFWTPWRPRA